MKSPARARLATVWERTREWGEGDARFFETLVRGNQLQHSAKKKKNNKGKKNNKRWFFRDVAAWPLGS